MQTNKHPYLIIGGTTKAGTTSIFKYLAAHPNVCASSLKETRFFLDTDYPLPSAERFSGNNLERYDEFFSSGDEHQLRVEATPDYLYSETALKIGELLPNAKLIFILRNPIDRLISWFKFAKQRGLLDNSVTLEEYVAMQKNLTITTDTPVHLRALEQGRYEQYVSKFNQVMPNNILVIPFDELTETPAEAMRKICLFAGLNAEIYDDYKFTIENKSISVNHQMLIRAYLGIRQKAAFILHKNKFAIELLRMPNKILKNVLGLNSQVTEPVIISTTLRSNLTRYYNK